MDRLPRKPFKTGTLAALRVFRLSWRCTDLGGQTDGLRVFAGVRLDPFLFDGVKAGETIVTRKLAFAAKGNSTMFRQNVLSIVIELDVATMFDRGDGPLFAIVGETATAGPLKVWLQRYGRPDIKNMFLPNDFDSVNRDIELRDLYKPGTRSSWAPHTPGLIARILAGLSRRPGGIRQSYKDIGVHDARYVLFDNDTRLLITISFDNDFDKYFDDALALFTGGDPSKIGFEWVEGIQGFPEGGYRSKTWEEVKNFLAETQVPAAIFANTDDASVPAIDKALRVQKAFQKVLDHPEAAQALNHPALKPLLDEAAD